MSITYEQIQNVNKTLSKTSIKGKDYIEVNERVKAFRQLFPDGLINTEILRLQDGICVIMARIYDGEGSMLATGIAEEKESASFINKTSYIENCETSAVGRALGFIAIGIDTAIASADEVKNAVNNQNGDDAENANIKKYAACLAKISDNSADEWIAKAREKYKTPSAQSSCLLKWFTKLSKEKETGNG